MKDQSSCQTQLSGSWNNANSTCTISGFYLNCGDSLGVEKGITLVISGGTFVNVGDIHNFGTIVNSGTLPNVQGCLGSTIGTITNNDGGIIDNIGGIFNGGGSMTNNFGGTINIKSSGFLSNEQGSEHPGSIDNSGEINNDGTITNNDISSMANNFVGIINNNGTITNNANSITTNNFGGIINNNGILHNHGGTTRNYGTLNNSGLVNNDEDLDSATFGKINNDGSINNYANIDNTKGSISNSNTINNFCGGIIIGNLVSGNPVINACHPTKGDIGIIGSNTGLEIGSILNLVGHVNDIFPGYKTQTTPKGILTWTDGGGGGTFSLNGVPANKCVLSALSYKTSSCHIYYSQPLNATVGKGITINATYSGDSTHHTTFATKFFTISLRFGTVTITPNPSTVTLGKSITLTGKVADTTSGTKTLPTGTITWDDFGKGGTFTVNNISTNVCSLTSVSSSASNCKVVYTPSLSTPAGSEIDIAATYSGDSTHRLSSGGGTLTVYASTTTKISPSTATVVIGGQNNYTVTVADTSPVNKTAPIGSVQWTSSNPGGSFNSMWCSLVPTNSFQSKCQITYTAPSTAGTVTITGTYLTYITHFKSSGKSTLTVS